MAPKRPLPSPEEAEDGGGTRVLKRWRPSIPELLGKPLMPQLAVELEKMLLRVVREEIMRVFANHAHPARLLSNQDQEIRYRLHFLNKLPNEFFTFKSILAEDGMNLKIALMDSNLREVITSDPLSSAKVEIVVVQGDFVSDRHENWTGKKFKDHVIFQRNGKGPVLTGELVIKLNKGVGYLAHATFTDNSSWTRNQKFRLVVKLSQSESIKDGVQEGISEPFRVKDRRVESNQKHDSPSLTDEVWRLKWIRKGGEYHNRLVDGGIRTVQQFLQALTMNQERLRSLLCYKAENKKWQKMVTHAQKCPVGNELYTYKVSGQNVVLIFDSVYQLIGAKFDGHYHSMDSLTAFQQISVDHWKKLAFENPNDIHIMADNLPLPIAPTSVPSVPASSSMDPQMPYSNGKNRDEATSQAGLWHQPNIPYNEHSNVLFPPEHIFVDGVHSIQEPSSFQEPKVSSGLSNGSIPMTLPTSIATAFPEPQNPDHRSTCSDEPGANMSFEQLLQDFDPVQQLALVQGKVSHMNVTLDELSFRTESCAGRVDQCMPDDECKAMILEYLLAPSRQKWVKLIAGLRCGISISKHMAAKRTGILCI